MGGWVGGVVVRGGVGWGGVGWVGGGGGGGGVGGWGVGGGERTNSRHRARSALGPRAHVAFNVPHTHLG